MKNLFSIFIISAIGLTLWWMLSTQRDSVLDTPSASTDGVDAYMNNFTLRAMNEDGKPALRLKAGQLRIINTEELAELDQPDIQLLDAGTANWHITANKGRMDERGNHVELESNVTINSIGASEPIHITTEQLSIDIDKQIISTNTTVNVKGPATDLTSEGLLLDNREGVLKLLAQVRGTHDPQ